MEKGFDEGRFHFLDGIIYHRTKNTCVMTLKDETLINTILNECHYSAVCGHLSEDGKLERVKNFSWWQNWRKHVPEYCKTCDRCQKANRSIGKKFRMINQIHEPNSPFKIVYMDSEKTLPSGGARSLNACLVLVDRNSGTLMFLSCKKDDRAIL
ncbi:hypothetical protein O181_116344 [Austropuccinia psidii MF-1]|uniref:Integrase zinc-binding domain-containing protein n=1 Tax=Austropuccinia psidii MF-1 TaxID=1389203 RepID=A0A9Q3K8N6_9BASI|nr:hypothetical protein [Austropuccinia psidii MF-1]